MQDKVKKCESGGLWGGGFGGGEGGKGGRGGEQ
jgi:hypothetical protein